MPPVIPALAAIGSAVGGAASAAGGAIASAGSSALAGLTHAGSAIMSGFGNVGGGLLNIGKTVGSGLSNAFNATKNFLGGMISPTSTMAKSMGPLANAANNGASFGKGLINVGKWMVSDTGKAVGKGLATSLSLGMTGKGLLDANNHAADAASAQASYTAAQNQSAADAEAATLKTQKDYLGRATDWASELASSSTSLNNNLTQASVTKSLLTTKLK